MIKIGTLKKTVFFSILLLILLINIISASDVAYIYRKDFKIDQNVLDVFSELGLEVDLITENYIPNNFDEYKFVFVGDERFRNERRIPIGEKASIVANYYFGGEWGLTDYDGISQLASSFPLQVRKGSQIIPVYTQAKYSSSSISIPYYYLDEQNKAPKMEKIAGTYLGNGMDLGDVISYSNPGTELLNGKNTDEKICFFGLATYQRGKHSSDYWTPEARNMFKDCIEFVGTTCENDDECGEETEDFYCIEKDVYKNITRYICENPGNVHSECVENFESEFVKECADACVNGECINIACYKDSDCDDSNDYTKDICNNPGTVESYCENKDIICLNDLDCGVNNWLNQESCSNNNIFDYFIEYTCINPGEAESYCSNSSSNIFKEDCGEDSCDDWQNYCIGNQVYKNRTCYDRGCLEEECDFCSDPCVKCKNSCDCSASCFTNINLENEFVENCTYGCLNGECLPKPPECLIDLDCGDESFSDNYCLDNNVARNHSIPLCINKECEINETIEIIGYCEYGCENAECIQGKHDVELTENYDEFNHIIRLRDSDNQIIEADIPQLQCNSLYDIQFQTNNIGNFIEDVDINLTISNLLGVVFNDIKIKTDLGIGESTITGNKNNFNMSFPAGFYNIIIESVIPIDDNPWNNIAFREIEIICPKCIEDSDCGEETSELICLGKNLTEVITTPTCSQGICENITSYNLIEECADACVNGECIDIACYEDADCGLDWLLGVPYCDDSNVFIDSIHYKCENPGLVSSYCVNWTNSSFVKDCTSNSCDDWQNYCVEDDVYEKRTCYSGGCSLGECISDFNIENKFVKKCSYGCANGECKSVLCGDGIINQASEDCDDGNNINGDGCSSDCKIEEIICSSDLDCGINGFIGDNFCSNNYVFGNYKTFTCVNPGLSSSYCTDFLSVKSLENCKQDVCERFGDNYCLDNNVYHNRTCWDKGCLNGGCFNIPNLQEELVEECSDSCINGKCVDIECYEDADCEDNNDYTKDICNNPGTVESYCENKDIICIFNLDCGKDEFTGDKFCSEDNKNVMRNFKEFKCENPLTLESNCLVNSNPKLIEECEDICFNGECVDIECYEDSDCDDSEEFTKDKCENPGTKESYCEHIFERCEEKIIDWYDTRYLTSRVKETKEKRFSKNDLFIDVFNVNLIEPFTEKERRMDSAVEIKKDGFIIFKNKMTDGGRVFIKPENENEILIQVIDSSELCPGGDNSACIYSRKGELLYSYVIASHSVTNYEGVLKRPRYIGECSGNIEDVKDEKILYCGLSETRVELKARDIIYFNGENGNELAGSGLEIWEYVGCE